MPKKPGRRRRTAAAARHKRCKGRPWRRTRERFFAADPLNRLCRECLKADRTAEATIVDHVIPVVDRPDLEFDQSNLQGLCQTCSDEKTARENAERRSSI